MALTPDDLSPVQRVAYETNEARVLVVGGPGTGKTLVAVLAARRVVEQSTDSGRALFLTFSRSATSELSRRAGGLLKGKVGEKVEVATFHGFAVGVLDAYRRYIGGPIEPVVIATQEEVSLGVAPAGSLQFGRIIPEAVNLFRQAPWILELYRDRLALVVCDEFQDTHDDQLELLEMLASDRRLICLADPEQMIFDGLPGNASVAQRITKFRETAPTEFDLGSESFRDTSQVIPASAAALRDRRFTDPLLRNAVQSARISVLLDDAAQDRAFREVQLALGAGAQSVGVFFATNKQVSEFSDRLRRESIDHDIAGLGSASGEAELAIAALASNLIGEGEWSDFLVRLGVFLASASRGTPPPLAHILVQGPDRLDETLTRLLAEETTRIQNATAAGGVGEFLMAGRSLWANVFRTRGRRLWELGIDDLAIEAIGLSKEPLNHGTAKDLMTTARRRRSLSTWDTLPGLEAPVQIMNFYQVKGRQMDVSVIVREPGDREPASASENLRLGRLVYVAVSRARQSSKIILPGWVEGYFEPYAQLAS